MVKKEIEIEVKSSSAEESLKKISDQLVDLNKNQDKINQNFEDTTKSLKKTESSVGALNKVANGFKGIGLAIKAAGIGLVISAFNFLKDSLMKNEKVAKTVEKVFNTISSVIGQLVEGVINAYNKVSNLTNGFEKTKKVIGGLIKVELAWLKTLMYGITLGVKELMLAWEKSVFGKGDAGKIKSLEADISGLQTKLKKTAEDMKSGARDVINNVGGMVGEVVKFGEEVSNNVEKINIKSTFNAQNAAKNQAEAAKQNIANIEKELSALENKRIAQEQIRDDETKSFEDRIAAGEEAKKIADQQVEKTKELSKQIISLANANYTIEKTNENRVAITEAQTAAQDKLNSSLEQSKSMGEQLNAVKKEEKNINDQLLTSNNDLRKSDRDFYTSRVLNEQEILKLKLDNIKKDKDENEELFKEKTKGLVEGTEAWIAALIEYNTKKTSLDQQEIATQDQLNKSIYQNKVAYAEADLQLSKDISNKKKDAQLVYLQTLQNLDIEKLKNFKGTEEERLALEKQISDRSIAINEEETRLKIANIEKTQQIAQQSLQAISDISEIWTNISLRKEQKALKDKKISQEQYEKNVAEIKKKAARRDKAMRLAGAVIDTAAAIAKANTLLPPTNIPAMIIAGALGAIQIAKIASAPIESEGGGGGGGGANVAGGGGETSAGTAPKTSFSFAPNQPTLKQEPTKAYVISKDVENQQQLDRQVIANGTI